jgi:hypothetical protein
MWDKLININVVSRPVARERPRNKQRYNSRYWAAVIAPIDELESGVFCAFRSDGCARNSGYSNRNGVFCAVRLDVTSRTVNAVQLSAVEWSEMVSSQWVRGQLQFDRCDPLLLEAEASVGSRYQATTGEDTAGWKRLSVCCSELQSVCWISDGVIVTCSYDL